MTSEDIKAKALELGFDVCGIAPVGAFPELKVLREWLDRGYDGTMAYLPRTAERRADVRNVVPTARSVIVTATVYNAGGRAWFEETDPDAAAVARYARADDYHDVIGARLDALLAWMREQSSEPFEARPYVDTGPVQERVYAQYAGIGWIGKNACVINPALGSWILLGEIICSLPLTPDAPSFDQCGQCALCLNACPTRAFVAPGMLDATKCISYLTIEYRGDLSPEQQAAIGNHAFGCDICQEVCPWNAMAANANDRWPARVDLGEWRKSDLMSKSDEEIDKMIEGTPLTRAGAKGLRRNIAAKTT